MRHTPLTLLLLLAPATTLAATLRRRELSPATGLSGSWTYSGCYVDHVADRALSSAFKGDGTGMNAQTCTAFCTAEGYTVAGVEYSSECWCGTTLPSQVATDPTTCNMPCPGDPTQSCGGPERLNVYSRPASAGPQTNPGPTGWKSLGCYTDNVGARTLSDLHAAGDQMTVELCAASCTGSTYFGVEYAGECFCGNSILNEGKSASEGCNMPCRGDTTEFCGGPNRLNLYQAISSPEPSPSPSPEPSPSPSPEPSPSPSPEPSPSPSPEPICAPTIQTGGQISNGGFELGSTWTRSTSANAVSKEISGLAYEGCYSELFSPTSPGPGARSVAIVSSASITPGTVHTISFYLGRRSPAAAANAAVTLRVNGVQWSQTFQACAGASCNLVGKGGTIWRKYQAQFTFTSPAKQALTIITSWSGATRIDGTDDVMIDGIYIS